jgi:hypothetical protein
VNAADYFLRRLRRISNPPESSATALDAELALISGTNPMHCPTLQLMLAPATAAVPKTSNISPTIFMLNSSVALLNAIRRPSCRALKQSILYGANLFPQIPIWA